jgi:hypothetical protein
MQNNKNPVSGFLSAALFLPHFTLLRSENREKRNSPFAHSPHLKTPVVNRLSIFEKGVERPSPIEKPLPGNRIIG